MDRGCWWLEVQRKVRSRSRAKRGFYFRIEKDRETIEGMGDGQREFFSHVRGTEMWILKMGAIVVGSCRFDACCVCVGLQRSGAGSTNHQPNQPTAPVLPRGPLSPKCRSSPTLKRAWDSKGSLFPFDSIIDSL